MSSSHDHAAVPDQGYGGGRTSRPLFALIPIGVLMVIVIAMLIGGVKVMTTPSDTASGEHHIVATTGANQGPGQGGKG